MKQLTKGLWIATLIIGVVLAVLLALNLAQGGIFVLEGLNGRDGADGADGKDGQNGQNGADGQNGQDGQNGKSAYQLAVEDGFVGSLHEWLLSLAVQGSNGRDGTGIAALRIDEEGHLWVTLTDGQVLDAGYVGGEGDGGFSDTPDADGFYETYETVVMNDLAVNLNLREKPAVSTDSQVLFVISSGDELLRIGDQRTDEGFSRFLYNGQVCYARSKYFYEKYESTEDVPAINLPASFVLTQGEQSWFYTAQIVPLLPAEYTVSYSYTGGGERMFCEEGFAVTPQWKTASDAAVHAPENATLTVKVERVFDGQKQLVAQKSTSVTVVAKQTDLAVSGIVIGDSRISDNTILGKLTRLMPNLTLMGTRQTLNSGIMHEGRSSWSAEELLYSEYKYVTDTQRVDNAFYDPAVKQFNFSYYMANLKATTGAKDPDFVILNLGANDNFSAASAEYLKEIVKSIRAWATDAGVEVKILVMTEYVSPAEGYCLMPGYNLNVEAKRTRQATYYAYLEDAFGGRESEGIYLMATHMGINSFSDWSRATVTVDGREEERITDVVHLGTNGYYKEADVICAYLYYLFGVKS